MNSNAIRISYINSFRPVQFRKLFKKKKPHKVLLSHFFVVPKAFKAFIKAFEAPQKSVKINI